MSQYLRVAIDMDSTLCDPFPAWRRHFDTASHPHREKAREVPPNWTYWADLCGLCFGEVLDDDSAVEFAPLVRGARGAIERLSEIAHLYLVTQRNSGQEEAVRKMLDHHGLTDRFDGVHAGWEKKSLTCGGWGYNCDIIVDDSPRVIADILASSEHISPICFANAHNARVPVPRCNSWNDVVDYIEYYFRHLRAQRLTADTVGLAGEAT